MVRAEVWAKAWDRSRTTGDDIVSEHLALGRTLVLIKTKSKGKPGESRVTYLNEASLTFHL